MNGQSFAREQGGRIEMEFCHSDSAELTNIISSIGSNSGGLDGVNLKIIRSILVQILPLLVNLINYQRRRCLRKSIPLPKLYNQMNIRRRIQEEG